MSDDFKKILENKIESYTENIMTIIKGMSRDIEAIEIIASKLIEDKSWEDFINLLCYLEDLQHDSNRCHELIYRGVEDSEILKRYSERCGNDE